MLSVTSRDIFDLRDKGVRIALHDIVLSLFYFMLMLIIVAAAIASALWQALAAISEAFTIKLQAARFGARTLFENLFIRSGFSVFSFSGNFAYEFFK